MSAQAIDALTAERDVALGLMGTLTPEEWEAPSDCTGWRVHDVFAHMASVFHQVADPASTPEGATGDAEATAELMVTPRRGWTSDEVVAEYVEWGDKALVALTGLQALPLAETVIPLGNLGHHPMHLLANALVFDHYCHLRYDVVRPGGPIAREPLPSDELRLRPTMEWMLGGLPQMCAAGLSDIDRPLNLVFTGPGGGSWVMRPPAPAGDVVTIEAGSDQGAAATVRSSAHDFVGWGTKRRDWRRSGVEVEGDTEYAASVLDAFNVI